MITVIILIIGLAAGFALGSFYSRSKQTTQPQDDSMPRIASLEAQLEAERTSHEKAMAELRRSNQEQLSQALTQQKEAQEQMLKNEREQLSNSFKALATEILKDKADNLNSENKTQIEAMLSPLNIKMKEFEDAVKAQQKSSAEDRTSILTTFKESVDAIARQTNKISDNAENLTNALKNNTKTQGDWGEMILESILEQSGLRKDEEYFIQPNYKTDEGRDVRPDVVVRFPEERCVIVDSKVSLTAYTNYINCDNDEQKAGYLKEHLKSVRKHVEELSEKKYDGIVEDSIGYVLMFIPNESSYICAIQGDSNLITDAYKKRILIISPSNLMMALQLAYNLWQYDRQNKNVQEIVVRGGLLYDKVVDLSKTLVKVQDCIQNADKSVQNAIKQMKTGNGNLIGQVEKMRKLGAKNSKLLGKEFTEPTEIEE